VRKAVVAVKALAPEKIRHDLLGKVFHELIPFEVRKAVAAFYTNNEAAEILAQLAIDKADAKVLDLACGSGTLLVAAYRRKRELLLREKGEFTFEDHKRFLEQDLTGIDIMPFAAHMAVVHLALQALAAGHEAEKVRIAVWDSTELEPGQTIPAISRELKAAYRRPTLELFFEGKPPTEEAYVEKGAVTLEGIGGEQIPLEKADVVIMNPPFTRHQRIPKMYKDALTRRFSENSEYLHGQMGYHGYFILLADKFLKNNGRLALVLPASILNADGLLKIRRLLSEKYSIEHIITTWQRSAFSESAQFREILLVAKKEEKHDNKSCLITELKKLPKTIEDAREIVAKIKQVDNLEKHGTILDNERMQISRIAIDELKRMVEDWFRLIAFTDKRLMEIWQKFVENAKDKLTSLGNYISKYGEGPKEGAALGQVFKGAAIGTLYIHRHPLRAFKKVDMWLLAKENESFIEVKHREIPSKFMIPRTSLLYGIRRFSGVNTIDASGMLDYIIADTFPQIEEFLSLGYGKRISAEFMKTWKHYVRNLVGNLLLANHVNVSAPRTTVLAYYASKPVIVPRSMWSINLPDNAAKIFSLWLNSSFGLLQMLMLRRETEGAYLWFVASTLRNFLVPNIDNLPENSIQELLDVFSKVRDVSFPCVLEQLRGRFWAESK
jgi:tRNA1(Val) A37 N6-methylase TrmN6